MYWIICVIICLWGQLRNKNQNNTPPIPIAGHLAELYSNSRSWKYLKYCPFGDDSPSNLTIIRRHIDVVRNSLPKVRQWQHEVHTIQQRCVSKPRPGHTWAEVAPAISATFGLLSSRSKSSQPSPAQRQNAVIRFPISELPTIAVISHDLIVKVLVYFLRFLLVTYGSYSQRTRDLTKSWPLDCWQGLLEAQQPTHTNTTQHNPTCSCSPIDPGWKRNILRRCSPSFLSPAELIRILWQSFVLWPLLLCAMHSQGFLHCLTKKTGWRKYWYIFPGLNYPRMFQPNVMSPSDYIINPVWWAREVAPKRRKLFLNSPGIGGCTPGNIGLEV